MLIPHVLLCCGSAERSSRTPGLSWLDHQVVRLPLPLPLASASPLFSSRSPPALYSPVQMAIADKWIETMKKSDYDWDMKELCHTMTNRWVPG
jgi:hypothetical protein